MKLNKEELIELMYAVGTEFGSYDDKIKAEAIIKALKDNDLEIEGYERSEWIKFDPNDPKTIPPKNTVVLLTIQGLPLEDNICTWRTNLQERHNACGLPGIFTHWRPLPNPPVETEKK